MEKYDKSSIESIIKFAALLTGKSLDEVVTLPREVVNPRNRGDLGKLVEQFFFEHRPPNNHDPDFADVGMELKTTGVLRNSDGSLRAKERLVLTQINYLKLAEEEWGSSTFLHKCRLMLILFYLYDKNIPVYDQVFILPPMLFEIPPEDLDQIRRDWELIRNKTREGRAHELSEGDTFYLSACRKGSGGPKEKLLSQPGTDAKAKSRAFSFKQSYLSKLIQGHSADETILGVSASQTFESATQKLFAPFIGKTVEEISLELGYLKSSAADKRFNRGIADRIMARGYESVSEIAKAGIEIKTIRLNHLGKTKEHMSFPGFKYLEIVEQEWEDSSFFEKLERKFLFVVFQVDEHGEERLVKVGYWNMPFSDREEARRVWEETRARIPVDATNLPGAKDSYVAHVRPKARNAADTIPTPSNGNLIKKCFWLNKEYVQSQIEVL